MRVCQYSAAKHKYRSFKKRGFHQTIANRATHSLFLFCSTGLPLACTRWVQLTWSSICCPLSINLFNVDNFFSLWKSSGKLFRECQKIKPGADGSVSTNPTTVLSRPLHILFLSWLSLSLSTSTTIPLEGLPIPKIGQYYFELDWV